MMYFLWIRSFHIGCAAASATLFAGRGLWLLSSKRPLWRWLRIVPHIIDTLLLASGLTLAFLLHQYPFVNSPWLTAKVVGLIVYIALGIVVFRGLVPRLARWALWVTALLVFGYIVSVAMTMQPQGFLAGIV